MSTESENAVSRRPLLAALGALALAGVTGGILFERAQLLRRGYRGPYAGLLSGLGDVENARIVGKEVLAQTAAFDAEHTARELRDAIGHHPLSAILIRETERGQVTEVDGWVLPKTLVWLCALAAKPS